MDRKSSGKHHPAKQEAPIVLSISMLTSGRKDMHRSLETLRLLREALPCEVILVDTGCSAEQRRMIEQYADRVLDFEWCDDFAAARNVGLREARGEWFLYLDDDEWFDDPKELIAFFRTGEYRQYCSASFIVRSYLDTAYRKYTDSYLSRLVKLEPGTCFTGKIHEFIATNREPRKVLGDIAHHDGYVFRDEAERRAHSERNRKPLLEMRERFPGDERWIVMLAQEYASENEYDKVVELCEKGLEECGERTKQGWAMDDSFQGSIHAFLLMALECLEEYGKEEAWLEKVIAFSWMQREEMEPAMAYFCFLGARLYSLTKRHERCRDYLRRYIDYAYKWRGDRKGIERATVTLNDSVFQPHTLHGTLMCVESLVRLEDYAFAEEAFYFPDWQSQRQVFADGSARNILDACCSVAYHPLWVRMLQTLVSQPGGMREMLIVFLERETAYRSAGEAEKLSRFYRLIAQLDYDHRYILCARIHRAAETGAKGKAAASCACRAKTAMEADAGADKAAAEDRAASCACRAKTAMEAGTETEEEAEVSGTKGRKQQEAAEAEGRKRQEAAEAGEEVLSEAESREQMDALFRLLFEKYPQGLLSVREEIWQIGKEWDVPLWDMFAAVDYLVWKHSLESWIKTASPEEIAAWKGRLEDWAEQGADQAGQGADRAGQGAVQTEQGAVQADSDHKGKIFRIRRLEELLSRRWKAGADEEDGEGSGGENADREDAVDPEELLWEYADAVLDLCGAYYREDVLARVPATLPEDIQLALRLKTLRTDRERGDVRQMLADVKNCLGIYPAMESAVLAFAEKLKDEAQKQNQAALAAEEELQRLADSLKAVARQQLAAGEYRTARDILLQIEQCAPGDEEVRAMLAEAAQRLCRS